MNYNPFNKKLNELNLKDIESLKEKSISEGWFIEYKGSVPGKVGKPDNLKIAKSISSFANTKGGWIFWGIESDDKNQATNICGIDISSYRNFEDQISQLLSSNISPQPIFHFKQIEVETDKIIFVIQVEASPLPPYITSQGIIYQRENNESKPIKDRYILEKLNEQKVNYQNLIENFCQFDLGETKGQSKNQQSCLELYLYPLPFENYKIDRFYQSDFFNEIAVTFYQNLNCNFNINGNEQKVDLNLGFNSIFSSERSLIIRPLNEKNMIYKSTTIELFDNGNLKFTIPLSEFDAHNYPKHYENSESLKYLLDKYCPVETKEKYNYSTFGNNFEPPKTVEERIDSDFSNFIKFIDGSELIFNIMIIVSKYKEVLKNNNYDLSEKIGFRARITDVWRRFMFFDSDDYLEKIKLFNIPLSPKNDIEIPNFINGKSYPLDLSENSAYLTIVMQIIKGIGIPDNSSLNYNEIFEKAMKRFN